MSLLLGLGIGIAGYIVFRLIVLAIKKVKEKKGLNADHVAESEESVKND